MKITLKDGSVREYNEAVTASEIAADIGLKKQALVADIDGETVDLDTKITKDCTLKVLTFEDEAGKNALRHTASHVLAQAVKRLFPKTKLAVGPAIEDGFYYDFDVEKPFAAEDLNRLEKEMIRIIKQNYPITRFELPRDEALQLMGEKNEDYKAELIRELPADEPISFYQQDDFVDLCAGPHLHSTGRVKSVKLLRSAGAYWRGDENNKMLQRIYGTAFEKKSELSAYVEQLREAQKRDHNKLGRELNFFMTSEVVGQGLPLMMPKGAKTIQILQRFVEDEEEKRGYLLTKTPLMAKSDLYKISGHWEHYRDGMFLIGDKDDETNVLALRPMTCPFQFMIYKAGHHSYRELPLRYTEAATLFRNEASGEMHGLIRIRQFTLADAHVICTPEQVKDEFIGVLDLIIYVMKSLGIDKDVTYRYSKRGTDGSGKYIDNPAAWEMTQKIMKEILEEIGLEYTEADGEAAFYGPKLDVQFKNVFGKEDTLFTVQVDFALAERFDMYYVDKDNEKKRPYIIHRSSIGCYERTLAMLIEKYAGALPLWMAPEQVRLLAITDRVYDYVNQQAGKLKALGIRAEADTRSEKIGYKIREARNERIPYILIVGDQEVADDTFAVRKRGAGDLGPMPAENFIEQIEREIAEKTIF